jgi:hypothetical protein
MKIKNIEIYFIRLGIRPTIIGRRRALGLSVNIKGAAVSQSARKAIDRITTALNMTGSDLIEATAKLRMRHAIDQLAGITTETVVSLPTVSKLNGIASGGMAAKESDSEAKLGRLVRQIEPAGTDDRVINFAEMKENPIVLLRILRKENRNKIEIDLEKAPNENNDTILDLLSARVILLEEKDRQILYAYASVKSLRHPKYGGKMREQIIEDLKLFIFNPNNFQDVRLLVLDFLEENGLYKVPDFIYLRGELIAAIERYERVKALIVKAPLRGA